MYQTYLNSLLTSLKEKECKYVQAKTICVDKNLNIVVSDVGNLKSDYDEAYKLFWKEYKRALNEKR